MPLPATLGTPIAAGRTAEIFAWGEGQILKLTRADFPPRLADQEWQCAQIIWQLGGRTPKPIELLEIAGRRGVVFERADGPNLLQKMRRQPLQLQDHARQLARLQAELHTLAAPTLPAQSERLAWTIDHNTFLPEKLKAALLHLMQILPDGEIACHGDFHLENIILTGRGPLIIDWESCRRGNPASDVAWTCLWIRCGTRFGHGIKGWLMRLVGRQFESAYLKEYKRFSRNRLEHLESWLAILAACHMWQENRHEFEYLLSLIEAARCAQPALG